MHSGRLGPILTILMHIRQGLYKTLAEDKMNKVLYILTLVTAVFIPAQFMTGLYGMNFPVMPEFSEEHGVTSYIVWWAVVAVSCGAVIGCFRRLGMLAV